MVAKRDAEVAYDGLSVAPDEYVGWLDVPMNDSLFVNVRDAVANFHKEGQDLDGVIRKRSPEAFERPVFVIRSYQERVFAFLSFACVDEPNDIRMIQFAADSDLPLKPLPTSDWKAR